MSYADESEREVKPWIPELCGYGRVEYREHFVFVPYGPYGTGVHVFSVPQKIRKLGRGP